MKLWKVMSSLVQCDELKLLVFYNSCCYATEIVNIYIYIFFNKFIKCIYTFHRIHQNLITLGAYGIIIKLHKINLLFI